SSTLEEQLQSPKINYSIKLVHQLKAIKIAKRRKELSSHLTTMINSYFGIKCKLFSYVTKWTLNSYKLFKIHS
ncbi:hypothetical protein BpHYR1_041539, partial [Brachionus plicatilis]